MSLVIGIGGLILLLVLGMPIGFALATSGALGLAAHMGAGIVGPLMADSFFEHSSSYLLLTIPMFVLMSEYLSASGIARDIVDASYRWVGVCRAALASPVSGRARLWPQLSDQARHPPPPCPPRRSRT